MKLEDRNKRALEKFTDKDSRDTETENTNDSLAEAMDLLYQVMNGSYAASGTPLDIEENGNRENLQSLYWRLKELLEKIGRNPEKTGFLAMSALEHTWNLARSLVLCPVSDMLDGNLSMLENAGRLEKILTDNEYRKIWTEKSAAYSAILERIGFHPEPDAFRDLTEIMDPLLDALTFYAPKKPSCKPGIWEVRHGEASESRNPAIAGSICIYRSEKELVDAVMGSGKDCMIAFGAVEKTHAQVKDYFYEWFHGFPEERQRNIMRNERLSEQQYLDMICDYTRVIWLCVKSGGKCWLVHMPWKGDYYSQIGNPKAEFYYGKRASYAPYQIFYKTARPAPEHTTMLAVKKTGYLLSDLMDPMSMAWYPAFLDETMKLFFNKDNAVPETDRLILAEETAAEDPAREPKENTWAVVPVCSGTPAVCSWTYRIIEPEDLFGDDENTLALIRYFHISGKDIRDIPILPENNGSQKELQSEADRRLKKAYLKLLAERIADLMDDRWETRRWLLRQMTANMDRIVKAAGDGSLKDFMTVTVDGAPVRNPDGTPRMVKRNKWPYNEIPEVMKTDMNDGRKDLCRLEESFDKMVFWYTKQTSGRPPVVWSIRPSCAKHYAMLAGVEEKILPKILRLSGPLTMFYEAYAALLPRTLTNKWTVLNYGNREKSIYIPCFGRINICMTKKAYRTFAGSGTKNAKTGNRQKGSDPV